MRILLLLCLAVSVTAAAESPPAFRWAKVGTGGESVASYGGPAVDPSGNAYVTGDFIGGAVFDSVELTNAGIFVAKYSRTGELVWAMQDGSCLPLCSSEDHVSGVGIAADNSGNALVVGVLSIRNPMIIAGETLLPKGNADIFVAKYGSTGSPLWARGLGTSGWDSPRDVAIDPEGNCIWSGVFGNTGQLGETNVLVNGGGLLAKVDRQGNQIWLAVVAGDTDARCHRVALDREGNMFVTGMFAGNASFGTTNLTAGNPYDYDLFLAKYSADGSLRWVRQAGGPWNDTGIDVAIDSRGNCLVAGVVHGPATFGDIVIGNEYDYGFLLFLAEYDTEGRVLWVESVLGPYPVVSSAGLVVDTADSVYVGYNGYYEPTLAGSGCYKYTRERQLVWHKLVPAIWLEGIKADAEGNLFLSGGFQNPIVAFDEITLTNAGVDRATFLAKLDTTLPPRLTIEAATNVARISWSALAEGFALESSEDPSASALWSTIPFPLVVEGLSNVVTVPVSAERMFYRLRRS